MKQEQKYNLLSAYTEMQKYCQSMDESCLNCALYNHDSVKDEEPCILKLYKDVIESNIKKQESK